MKEKIMKRTLFIILSVVVVFVLIGITFVRLTTPRVDQTFSTISNALPGAEPSFGMGGGAAPAAQAPAMEAPLAAPDAARNAVDTYSTTGQVAQERLVIENADLTIVIKDPKTRMKEISDLAKEMGGFVVSSNMYQNTSSTGKQVPQGSIVIRVPSEKLDEALSKIKEGAIDVPSENRSGQDVTSQYVDLQAQLTAKQAAEKKLLEIMDKATRAEDVLAVYLQVQTVQT
jgi:hypothetical protein